MNAIDLIATIACVISAASSILTVVGGFVVIFWTEHAHAFTDLDRRAKAITAVLFYIMASSFVLAMVFGLIGRLGA